MFVTPGIPAVTSDLAPGTKELMWSPISSTLIFGKRDSVLVDTFISGEGRAQNTLAFTEELA